jgi:hypothetical protein
LDADAVRRGFGDRLVSGLERRFEPRRLEVINGAGGRRDWSADAKAAVPDEMLLLGAVVLVLNRSEKAWKLGPREWGMSKAQFAVIFGERFTRAMAA